MHSFPNLNGWAWALVPVKELAASKRRLKDRLGGARPGLTMSMLRDLMLALTDSRETCRVAIVTAEDCVKQLGRDFGAMIVDEPGSGDMNLAIRLGVAAVREAGGQQVAIYPADLPLATGREIDRLLRAARAERQSLGGHVTGICPSRDLGGTNMLYLDTGRDFPFSYGPGSFDLHCEAAARTSRVLRLSSAAISLDIDHAADLDEFIAHCRLHPRCQDTETWRYLESLGLTDPAEIAQGIPG